ncbi:MAG: hypothetical protein M3N95_08750 [Actinomycetota bacterium]|nr:hypothetical protein [Actinomycetota bacterium]
MTSRHTGPARIGLSLLPVLLAAELVAGCGGSSGVHTQAPTSDSPTPSASVTSGSSSTSSSTSSSAPTSSSTTIPTPSVTAPAQDAVDAYITFYGLSTAADKDPANADVAQIDQYLTGKAKTLYDSVYASMKADGVAYRGTPDAPRLKVGSILSPTFMFLTSCPAPSASDPFIQYKVSTGKPITVTKPPVAPPWKRTISMKKVGSGWKVSDILVDTSKTCSG